jgi:hypothetical protein
MHTTRCRYTCNLRTLENRKLRPNPIDRLAWTIKILWFFKYLIISFSLKFWNTSPDFSKVFLFHLWIQLLMGLFHGLNCSDLPNWARRIYFWICREEINKRLLITSVLHFSFIRNQETMSCKMKGLLISNAERLWNRRLISIGIRVTSWKAQWGVHIIREHFDNVDFFFIRIEYFHVIKKC